MNSDHKPWLKICLGHVYCVEKVVRYKSDGEVYQTWTCTGTENNCTGTGIYSPTFFMTISTEGAAFDLLTISDCSFGDTVTYRRKIRSTFRANEMVIIGRVISGGIDCDLLLILFTLSIIIDFEIFQAFLGAGLELRSALLSHV